MDMNTPPDQSYLKPGSNASIEHRVERLEGQVNSLSTQVQLLSEGQKHIRELMDNRFNILDGNLKLLDAKLDGNGAKFDATFLKLQALITGEQVHLVSSEAKFEQLNLAMRKIEEHDDFIEQFRGVGNAWRYIVGAGVISIGISIFALLHTLGVL